MNPNALQAFLLLFFMFTMVYAICYMIGGAGLANRFVRWIGRLLRGIAHRVGETLGRFVTAHPVFFGTVAIGVALYLVIANGLW